MHETQIGRIGGLICPENYMPLAGVALYSQGVEIYLAPTADAGDTWQATLQHIACEGRCFVLGCNQFVTREMYPPELAGLDELRRQPDILSGGGSAIISPLGETLAGPVFGQEDISVLCEFRQRLVRHQAQGRVFDTFLRRLKEKGFLNGGPCSAPTAWPSWPVCAS